LARTLPGRVLALDVGNRRTGVAISDALRITARPLLTLERSDPHADVVAIADLVADHQITAIVVGHPLLPSGDRGEQALLVEAFAAALTAELEVPVVLWDESYTTQAAAERVGRGAANLDAAAAAVILEEWLHSTAAEDPDRQP
jgi:putative Holliday junction resolvase